MVKLKDVDVESHGTGVALVVFSRRMMSPRAPGSGICSRASFRRMSWSWPISALRGS